MKKSIIIVFILLIACKPNNKIKQYKTLLDKNKVYVFFRGTHTKQGIIVKKYNIKDKNISHVGIGYYQDNDFVIYNIEKSNKKNHFIIDCLDSFYSKEKKVEYGAIWEIKNLKNSKKIHNIIDKYKFKTLQFDSFFENIEDDNKYYCSDLVVSILNDIDSKKFKFIKKSIKIESFYATFLKKDTLAFYPADVFTINENFKKIIEF